jgi:hypothetical protein
MDYVPRRVKSSELESTNAAGEWRIPDWPDFGRFLGTEFSITRI